MPKDSRHSEKDPSGKAVNDAWRNPAAVRALWEGAASIAPAALEFQASPGWWDLLSNMGATLLVTREYEHLLLALSAARGVPRQSWMTIPHPSGMVYDARRGVVHVASTRNPNMLYEFEPVSTMLPSKNAAKRTPAHNVLVPARASFLPGCLYLHDLALIRGVLHGAAAGRNAIVRFNQGRFDPVWWPSCIERADGPAFNKNVIQLNGIAAGATLEASCFTASAERIGRRYPGDPAFPVDRRGAIFSGVTREPIARGLTRPHSPRWHRRQLWVCDSGYGRLAAVRDDKPETVAALPGWTRGLCMHGPVAFVGVSRVLPRFASYAPGLDVDKARCGVYALDARTGDCLAHIEWPGGNQIFNVVAVPAQFSPGFSATEASYDSAYEEQLAFSMDINERR